MKKLAWGTAVVAVVAAGAFLFARPRPAQSDDTRPERHGGSLTARVIEVESLKKDLEAVVALNKLRLTAEQTEALLDAAKKTDALKRSFLAERSGDIDQAVDVMTELRSALNRGEATEDVQEEADLIKRRMERFQKKFEGQMDTIVDGVLEALKDVRPVEAEGDILQAADAVAKVEQALDEIRYMGDDEYAAKIDGGIDQHLDKVGIQGEERATEHARIREVVDKARSMGSDEYENHVHDLAEEVLLKGATGERVAGKVEGKGKDVRRRVKEFLLRDSTVGILQERLDAIGAK